MRYLFCALLTLVLAGDGWSGQIFRGSTSAGAEPAAGTVLFGVAGTTTASFTTEQDIEYYNSNTPYTATWPESASTTTCSAVKVTVQGWAGGDVKAVLRNSSGTVVAQTTPLTVGYEESPSIHTLSFSSPPTITKGDTYYLSLVLSANYAVLVHTFASTGVYVYEDNTGTYASPGASISNSATAASDQLMPINCVK